MLYLYSVLMPNFLLSHDTCNIFLYSLRLLEYCKSKELVVVPENQRKAVKFSRLYFIMKTET